MCHPSTLGVGGMELFTLDLMWGEGLVEDAHSFTWECRHTSQRQGKLNHPGRMDRGRFPDMPERVGPIRVKDMGGEDSHPCTKATRDKVQDHSVDSNLGD